MAPTWQEREQAFEAKYAHDEEFRFRVTARRDKLFAQWLATRCGLDSAGGESLKAAILAITDGRGHDGELLRHATSFAGCHGTAVQDTELATALNRCGDEARSQLLQSPNWASTPA